MLFQTLRILILNVPKSVVVTVATFMAAGYFMSKFLIWKTQRLVKKSDLNVLLINRFD